jgi:hypothetical protein
MHSYVVPIQVCHFHVRPLDLEDRIQHPPNLLNPSCGRRMKKRYWLVIPLIVDCRLRDSVHVSGQGVHSTLSAICQPGPISHSR